MNIHTLPQTNCVQGESNFGENQELSHLVSEEMF